ncbi:MAG TPA: TolC family protein [Polyangiales bacterium]
MARVAQRLPYRVLAALIAVALLNGPAGRLRAFEVPTTDPVLARLIEESLAVRPELARVRATARAERERVRQASALPDPMLQVGVQNDTFTDWNVGKMETSWYAVMASQTFPGPGKRRLRNDVAQLSADQADANVARVSLSTEAEVRRAYLGLVLARERLALLLRLEAIWQKSAGIAHARYEAGQGAQSDVLRAQLELNRIRQRRWSLQADIDSASQTLNRLRGRALDEPIVPGLELEAWPLPEVRELEVSQRDATQRSPELAAARVGVRQAERGIDLAHKSYLPDLTVSAGVMPRGGAFPPMWLLNVGGTVPVFAGSKQDRALAESEARAAASRYDVEALEQILRLRAAQRRTALASTLEIVRLYREGLLVQSEATAESTLAQYEVGRVTFASVLEANAGFIADRDGYLQAIAQAQGLQIDGMEVSLANVPSIAGAQMGTTAMPGSGGVGSGSAMPSGTATESRAVSGPAATSGM